MTEMHEFESLFYKIRNSAEPKKSNDVKDLTNFLRYNSVQPSLADQGYSVVIISRVSASHEEGFVVKKQKASFASPLPHLKHLLRSRTNSTLVNTKQSKRYNSTDADCKLGKVKRMHPLSIMNNGDDDLTKQKSFVSHMKKFVKRLVTSF